MLTGVLHPIGGHILGVFALRRLGIVGFFALRAETFVGVYALDLRLFLGVYLLLLAVRWITGR